MADRTLKVTLRANVAEFQSNMAGAAKSVREVYDQSTDAEQRLQMQSQAMTELGQQSMVAGGLIVAGIGLAVASYADFDSAMSEVQASTHETASNMGLLRDAAVEAGAATVFSATESANAIDELAKAGLSTQDILGGGLTGALDLAAAGGLGVARAAEISAISLSQFGLAGSEAGHVADILAAGAGKALGSVDDLANGLKFVGPIANSMGVSIEETTGVLALFAQQGIIGEQAGTSLRGVLASLTSPSKEARAEIERLGLVLYDSQGNFMGLQNAAGQLSEAYGTMDGASRDASLGVIFGRETVTAATALYQSGAEGVAEWTQAVDDSGFAAETARLKLDNLKGDVEGLGGSFDTFMINVGAQSDGLLRGAVQGLDTLVDAAGQLPEPILAGGLAVAGLMGGVLLLGGAALVVVPQIGATVTSLATLGITAGTVSGALTTLRTRLATTFTGGRVLGITAATAAVALLGQQITEAANSPEEMSAALKNATGNLDLFTAASMRSKGGFGDFLEFISGADLDMSAGVEQLKDFSGTLDQISAKQGNVQWDTQGLRGAQMVLKDLGEEIANLDPAAASEMFGSMSEEAGLTRDQMVTLLDQMPAYRDALLDQAAGTGIVEGALDSHEEKLGLVAFALGEGTEAGDEFSGSLANGAASAEEQAVALEELQGQIDDAAAAMHSLIGDEVGFYDTLAKSNEIIAENGMTLDLSTEAGRENRLAVADLAQSTTAYAESLAATGATQDEVNAVIAAGRQEFIASAEAAGYTREEAEALANELNLLPRVTDIVVEPSGTIDRATREVMALLEELQGLPPNTDVHTTALTDAAVAKLEALGVKVTTLPDGTVVASADTGVAEAALDQLTRPRTVSVTVNTTTYSTSPYNNGSQNFEADGGIYSHGVKNYADGGLRFPLPAGSVLPGIYPGGADIVHFAEKETRREAYISDKPGMEARNMGILAEAAGWFGLGVTPMANGGVLGPYERNGGGQVGLTGSYTSQLAQAALAPILAGGDTLNYAPQLSAQNLDVNALADVLWQNFERRMRWQRT